MFSSLEKGDIEFKQIEGNKSSPFSKIPDEVFVEMLLFLELKDIFSLIQTCSEMYLMINSKDSTFSSFWKFCCVMRYQKEVIFDDSKIDKDLTHFVESVFDGDWKLSLEFFCFHEKKQASKRKTKFKDNDIFKMCILGMGRPGKTSFTRRILGKPLTFIESTIGAAFFTKIEKIGSKREIKFEIWDTSGQDRYSSLLPMYYRGARIILLFYDLTDESTIDGMEKLTKEIISHAEDRSVRIYFVGGKSDLTQQRRVTKNKIENITKKFEILNFEISSLTGEGIDIFYKRIIEDIANPLNNSDLLWLKRTLLSQEDQIKIDLKEFKKRKKCLSSNKCLIQ